VFKHALVQDAAYESLLKSRRAQLHAQIGRAIEERYPEMTAAQPELLAHHFTAAHLLEDAIGYWHKAGELALKRVAVTEAIAHLDGGMKLVQLPASRGRDVLELDLHATLAAARIALHGWAHPKVAENLEPAWRLTQALDRDEHSLRILWGLWIFQMCIGHVRESLSWSEQLLAEAARKDRMDLRLAGH
jgi:hypothetical protein